jgi:hypothetical protein
MHAMLHNHLIISATNIELVAALFMHATMALPHPPDAPLIGVAAEPRIHGSLRAIAIVGRSAATNGTNLADVLPKLALDPRDQPPEVPRKSEAPFSFY